MSQRAAFLLFVLLFLPIRRTKTFKWWWKYAGKRHRRIGQTFGKLESCWKSYMVESELTCGQFIERKTVRQWASSLFDYFKVFASSSRQLFYNVLHSTWQCRVFSRDVMAAILVSLNKGTTAMLVSPTNPLGIELCSYANIFFCFGWKTCSLVKWVETLNTQTAST